VDSNDITAQVSGEQKQYFHLWGKSVIFSVARLVIILHSVRKLELEADFEVNFEFPANIFKSMQKL
jgi:hypothetical protein